MGSGGVLDKLKEAKAESSGNVDYFCKVFGVVCCGTICALTQIILCLAVPIACIVIGSLNLKDCRKEKYIPIYLVVAGVFGVVKGIVNTVFLIINKVRKSDEDTEDESEAKKNMPNPIDALLNCFLMAWFIAGSVWVYRIYGDIDYNNTNSDDYCDKTTYLFTFWLITITYSLMALGLLCCCGFCGVMICVAVGSSD